jgi:Lipocalin-like domain
MDLVGTWQLDSAYFIAQKSGDRVDLLGANPFGFFILDANGRLIVLMTSDVRAREAETGDTTALFKSMISYTGRLMVDGETAITQVDAAWDPSWVGTEQLRYFTVDGHSLSLRSAPLHHPSFPDDEIVAYTTWDREA